MRTFVVLQLEVDSDTLKKPEENDKDIEDKTVSLISDLVKIVLQHYYPDTVKLVSAGSGKRYNIEPN